MSSYKKNGMDGYFCVSMLSCLEAKDQVIVLGLLLNGKSDITFTYAYIQCPSLVNTPVTLNEAFNCLPLVFPNSSEYEPDGVVYCML